MIHEKKLLITDIDSVLCLPDPKWVGNSFKEDVIFKRIENWSVVHAAIDGKEAFARAIMNRTDYDLARWLGLPNLARSTFIDVYKNDKEFYSGMPFTKFGQSLMLKNHSIKIVFVTHVLGGNSDQSKYDWIHSNFKTADFVYEAINISTPKSEVISKLYGDFDVFIDDSPSNLIDVMEKCGDEKKEFIYPSYGYNQGMVIMAKSLAETKKFKLTTF